MNRIKRFIVNRKIVQRLIQLDGILKESQRQAMLARMFSRTKGGMWQRSREKHRSLQKRRIDLGRVSRCEERR